MQSFEAFKPSDSIYAEPFKHTNVGPQLEAGLHRNRKRSPVKNWFSSFTKGFSKQKDSQEDRSGGGYDSGSQESEHIHESTDSQQYRPGGGYDSGSQESEHIYENPNGLLPNNFQSTDSQQYRRGGGYNSGSHKSKHIYAEITGNLNINLQPTDSQKYQSGKGYESRPDASSSDDNYYYVIPKPESEPIYEDMSGNL
ncbi:hypothetical protein PV326_001456 [Microctonus aethiopoides]|nr:hypothetical protein PV326_001456 [Microctonus aethiopoides]